MKTAIDNVAIWAVLIVVLIAGLVVHQNAWQIYWALWLTETITFMLITLYFYSPSNLTGFGALGGSLIWLLNQVACWYYAADSHTSVYAITLGMNALLLAGVLLLPRLKRDAYGLKRGDGKDAATAGLVVMVIFAVWKLYMVNVVFAYGSAVFNSALLWGLGILVTATGSIITLLSKDTEKRRYGTYIGATGLIIASCAALYYGLALSVI
jgi:hypothetical protein